jgi:hypothetical protein
LSFGVDKAAEPLPQFWADGHQLIPELGGAQ